MSFSKILRINAQVRIGLALLALALLASPAIAQPRPQLILKEPAEEPVRLRSMRIHTDVLGSIAVTSVELRFFNPNARVLEGELQFPLLDGQTVIGFAMDVDGTLRDAVPVEKARAQEVFEDITRLAVEPGLLEATGGNNYRVRIYPLPRQGEKVVVMRYAETLIGTDVYRLR